jgi:hypothetical protein
MVDAGIDGGGFASKQRSVVGHLWHHPTERQPGAV